MKNKNILKFLLCSFFLIILKANAQDPIYSNGSLSTGAVSKSGVAAPAGYTWSECQNNTGNTSVTNYPVVYTTSIYSASGVTQSIKYLADDFVIPAGQNWNIDAFEFFYYDLNATTAAEGAQMSENNVFIYNVDPTLLDATPFAIATITASHLAVDAGMYHIANSSPPFNNVATANFNRKIWKEKITMPATNFPAGQYYIIIGFRGSASRAFPMVKVPGKRGLPGWNAKYKNQITDNIWKNIVDDGQPTTSPVVKQDLPFNIYGFANGLLTNDACAGAKLINEFPYNYNELNGYLATNNNGFINAACSSYGGMNDGEWFKVQGTGANIVVAVENVNLAYDPQVTVYTGTCGNLTCVASADAAGDGGIEILNIPNSNQDTTYYINVGNYGSSIDGPEFNFSIFVNSTPTVRNDACVNATVVGSLPYSFAENEGALATNNSGFLNACSNGMNDGEWFKVIGTGNVIEVKTDFTDAAYDSQIGVFTGSCGNFTCVNTVDGQSAGGPEILTFPSEAGVTYYINIGNYSDVTDFPEGDFSIFIKQFLANDECSTAKNISTFPYEFNEVYGNLATNNGGIINTCAVGMNDGEWYTFTGTGRKMIIELSNVQNNYDPEIAVYTGSCGALVCESKIDIGDLGQGEKLTLTSTTLGTTYYVNVGHYSDLNDNPEGNFKITFNELLLNDDCLNATNVPSLPYTYLENSGTLTSNNNGFRTECAVGMNDGEWFKVFGNGGEIRIDLTQVATNYDVEIGVYSGTCFNLTCIANRDNNAAAGGESLLFDSVVGQTYYINIGHFFDNFDAPEGNFKIDITTIVLANNSYDFKNLKMFPNPVTNILNIENSEKIDSISVSNLLGQELINQKNNDLKAQIDMSTFQNGAYLVKVNSENAAQVFKILKN